MKYICTYIVKGILGALYLFQAIVFVSCAKEDFNWLIGTPINVIASTDGSFTRSGANIQTSNFDADENINAYFCITGGDTIGNTPTLLTTSAADASGKNRLTPDVQPYYPSTGTVDIYALYPTTVTSASTSFAVQADQTATADYKKSDLMWASKTAQAKTEDDVNLQFAHKMAKISIDVTGAEGVTIKNVKLTNTVREIALTGIATSSSALGALASPNQASEKEILVATTSETDGVASLSGSVLFPPQTIAADFIEVETNYGTTKFSTSKTFNGGTEYKASLTITRQLIGFTSTITDWTADQGTIAVPPGSSAGLLIGDIDKQDYTGSEIEPTLNITYDLNDKHFDLVRDVDYELTFFNNVNQGVATIIINGKADPAKGDDGIIIGKIRAIKSFVISAATGSISYPNNNAKKTVEYQYNTMVENPLELNGGDGTLTFESTDPTVAKVSERGRVTILKVGTTTIKAHMAADGNYTEADAQYELEITARKLKAAKEAGVVTISLAYNTIVYTGQAYYPAVVVADKGRTLQQGTHYTLSYANNTNKGTATVTVRGAGNYSSAAADDAMATFTITQATPTISLPSTEAITLPIGFSATRRATSDLGTVTYSSSSNTIATVDNDGMVTAVSEGTATITAKVTADANENYPTTSVSYAVKVIKSEWTYDYTGKVAIWTCPLTGVYKLEAYGAQGGSNRLSSGGAGAYIAGQLKVTANQVIYIYVGQQGADATTASASQGGWNGGGKYTGTNATGSDQTHYCGGGGATDFSLQGTDGSSEWDTDAHWKSRILVAGGGGGALLRFVETNYQFMGGGGSGGAYVGEEGYAGSVPGGGGTLSAGGAIATNGTGATAASFGKGGGYNGTYSVGMGGGGWYGGASGATDSSVTENASNNTYSRQGSGGGGSSYIWNAANSSYYNGHGTNNAPAIPSGSVMTSTNSFYMTPAGMTLGARSGNGRAIITYMGEDE